MNKLEKLTVQEFSMLPMQAYLKIDTPEGEGSYEGITSSGIIKVLINGGLREYSWSEVTPKIMLRHILIMEDFVNKWKNMHSRIVCICNPDEKHGETAVMCCNECGLPTEEFWTSSPMQP